MEKIRTGPMMGTQLTNPRWLYIKILKYGHKVLKTERDGNAIEIWLDEPDRNGDIFSKVLIPSIEVVEYNDGSRNI